jgi:hypothetical protein
MTAALPLHEIDALVEATEKLICPYDVAEHPDHRCPRRWFVIATLLPADEANELRDLLNE